MAQAAERLTLRNTCMLNVTYRRSPKNSRKLFPTLQADPMVPCVLSLEVTMSFV